MIRAEAPRSRLARRNPGNFPERRFGANYRGSGIDRGFVRVGDDTPGVALRALPWRREASWFRTFRRLDGTVDLQEARISAINRGSRFGRIEGNDDRT